MIVGANISVRPKSRMKNAQAFGNIFNTTQPIVFIMLIDFTQQCCGLFVNTSQGPILVQIKSRYRQV